jgi:hypothetical protein
MNDGRLRVSIGKRHPEDVHFWSRGFPGDESLALRAQDRELFAGPGISTGLYFLV